MIFKERRFRGEVPDTDKQEADPPSSAAEMEVHAADVLASVADLDATQISVVLVDGALVMSGYVATEREALRAEEALRLRLSPLAVQNRLQVG